MEGEKMEPYSMLLHRLAYSVKLFKEQPHLRDLQLDEATAILIRLGLFWPKSLAIESNVELLAALASLAATLDIV